MSAQRSSVSVALPLRTFHRQVAFFFPFFFFTTSACWAVALVRPRSSAGSPRPDASSSAVAVNSADPYRRSGSSCSDAVPPAFCAAAPPVAPAPEATVAAASAVATRRAAAAVPGVAAGAAAVAPSSAVVPGAPSPPAWAGAGSRVARRTSRSSSRTAGKARGTAAAAGDSRRPFAAGSLAGTGREGGSVGRATGCRRPALTSSAAAADPLRCGGPLEN